MSQEIHLNMPLRDEEVIEFIDFGRERWTGALSVWLDRRYRVMPLDGYNSRYPSIDASRDNINVKDPVFQRR
jgi:hypothetical protein